LDAVTLEVVDPEGGGKSQEPEAKILKGKG